MISFCHLTVLTAFEQVLPFMNPWALAKSQSGRNSQFRAKLLSSYNEAGLSPGRARCQATGEIGSPTGNNHEVVVHAAHIIPVRCPDATMYAIGLDVSDKNSARNGLLLAVNIEIAFDNLKLSFVPSNPLDSLSLVLKIWDKSIRDTPIWPNSARTIGEFEGMPLLFEGQPLIESPSSANALPAASCSASSTLSLAQEAAFSAAAAVPTTIPCRRALWFHAHSARNLAIKEKWVTSDEADVAPFGPPARESAFGNMCEQIAKHKLFAAMRRDEDDDVDD